MKLIKKLNYLIDLDGTVYRGMSPIPEAREFIRYLNKNNRKFLIVTNCPENTPLLLVEKLKGMDIHVSEDNILTSGQVTASYIASSIKKTPELTGVYLIGSDAMKSQFARAGIRLDDVNPGYVVVGFDRRFSFEMLSRAVNFILKGAEFICTNRDSIIPDGDMVIPHTGAIAAAIEAAAGIEPLVMGKPEGYLVDEALTRLGCSREECCIIGDRLDTDILTGVKNNIGSYLVLTGVTGREQLAGSAIKPDRVFDNLMQVIEYEQSQGR